MKTPCEIIVWQVLPVIRKEFAKKLVEDYDFSQKKAAQKLGVTEAAVSRYISGKRGSSEKLNKNISEEISKSVNRLALEDDTSVINEICRICGLLKSSEFFEGINYSCH